MDIIIKITYSFLLKLNSKAIYFKNKEQTLNYLKKNLTSKKSIDVGCMQINTKYHLRNFNSLTIELFDLFTNFDQQVLSSVKDCVFAIKLPFLLS